MGRNKSGIPSGKDILRELAAERRATRQSDIDSRNSKIFKMVELGCSYEDIGRRYGLAKGTVKRLVYDHKVAGIGKLFGNALNLERACFICDPPED